MNEYKYIIDKYKIDKGRQHIIEIPDMDSLDLADLFHELNYKVGVELGVAKGEYSEIICKANPQAKLYSIDPYTTEAYEPGTNITRQTMFDDDYEFAVNRLKPYNCEVVRKTSEEALKDFEDNSLDFVYIDANHDFYNFTFDLHFWLKKVREGGIMSGHDYVYMSYKRFHHVRRALEAYSRCYRMQPLFVCGITDHGTRNRRDRYRSWFWVKKEGGLQE